MAEKKPENPYDPYDEKDASIGCAQCNVRQLPDNENGFPVWPEKRYTNFTAEEIVNLTIDDVHNEERPKRDDCENFDVGENFMPSGPDEDHYEFETVLKWAELISELPENPAIRDAFHCWVESTRSGDEQKPENIRLEDFHEQYRGTYENFSNYAQGVIDEIMALAKLAGIDDDNILVLYFDEKRFTDNLEHEMTVVESDANTVHVFETS